VLDEFRRCCNLHSQNSLEEVNMFHKILVAMDTSTIGKSVFDSCLGKATGSSLMLLRSVP